METRKYLKTAEDVLALKDTDTKIFEEAGERFNEGSYYKFINGVLCRFDSNKGEWQVNISIWSEDKPYILEEPMKEATTDDVGKLCWFENKDRSYGFFDFLEEIFEGDDKPYQPENTSLMWHHCRRATPSEVAELTGYKVEEK